MSSVFVLSGISGTGKSTILEHSRSKGLKVLKSHTKHLLNMRFGVGESLKVPLELAYFLQAVAISDFDLGNEDRYDWMCERSILDQYYFRINRLKYVQNLSDFEDMFNAVKSYYNYITAFGKRNLVIIDIHNYDSSWILDSLLKDEFKRMLWKSVDDYLSDQISYKKWYFDMMDSLDIPYEVIRLDIQSLSHFNAEKRDEWITKNILNR